MDDIEYRFWLFHIDNPKVYEILCRLARGLKRRGYHQVGIKMIWEVMRWQMFLATKDPSGFKLNDHYTSRYARLIMKQEPDLDGLFELRALRTPSEILGNMPAITDTDAEAGAGE